jgi:hypothetical protein
VLKHKAGISGFPFIGVSRTPSVGALKTVKKQKIKKNKNKNKATAASF